jgi:hypothetical protein
MKRVHITGCPRSGTTLLFELVSSCFRITGKCRHELSLFKPVGEGDGIFVSKQPTDVLHLHHVLDRDPDLYVLYIYRDPRAVISSRHASWPQSYFSNYRIWKECETAARKLRGHPRMLELGYELLVAAPHLCQIHIHEKFPFLDPIHSFSEFERYSTPDAQSLAAMNGLSAIDGSRCRKWKQHLPRVKGELLRHPEMQFDLEFRAYESDNRWQSTLADVSPQHFPCRYPDSPRFWQELERRVRLWFKVRRYLGGLGAKARPPMFVPLAGD